MNTKMRLNLMKNQLIIMMNEAIAHYDKAIERQHTVEWEEYADKYDLSMWYLEEMMGWAENEVDKLVDRINEELYVFEAAAELPFEEFI